jgi:hypothetical protein
MHNKANLSIIVVFVMAAGLGCGYIGGDARPDTADNSGVAQPRTGQPLETALREKTGVQECDELIDFFTNQAVSPDENYISRGLKEYFFNKIRQSLKESIEQNQNDPAKMAKECREIKQQIDAQKAAEASG